MKKKELLEMPKLTVTKAMMNRAVNDIATKDHKPQYTRYYRALQQGDILKIAIWTRQQLIHKGTTPKWEIYIDKANDAWLNYNPKQNAWGKARIENLNMGSGGSYEYDYYGVRGWESDKCRKLVNQYFGKKAPNGPNLLIRDAVKEWQKGIADASLRRRYQRELEHIDSIMNLVPELPKDFEKWAQTEAYHCSQYMIYDRSAKKARCTNCWSVVPAPKEYRHNESVRCPVCRLEVTCKSWGMQKTISDRKYVGIIQRLRDRSGYILRRFETQMRYRKEKNYSKEWWIHESTRFLLSPYFIRKEDFEWGEYKNTGQRRWCHELNHGFYYYCSLSAECILYHRNIKKMLADTNIKYIPVAQILKKDPGTYCNADTILRNAERVPQIEMLHKVGLNKLAAEYLDGSSYNVKKWNRESPWAYLDISKEYLQLAVKMNAKERHIEVMRQATRENIKLNKEQIAFYAKYFNHDAEEIFALGHTEKMYKYLLELQKQDGDRAMGDYRDYIDDLRKLGIAFTKQALFPKNFGAEHREVAEMRLDHENKLAAMKLRQKNREFRKMLPDIRKLFECENEEFKIVVPTCKKDFQDEGREQHNCVGGSYFDKMLRGDCVVVFLRQQSDPKKSYCTVEFAPDGSVRQNRAIYNRAAPEEAEAFINSLSKKLKRTIAKERAKAAREAEEQIEIPVLAYAN